MTKVAAISAPRAQEVFETLQRRILSDDLPSGSRLPAERELARELNTNRNTLREALRRLEQLGLVSVKHGRGVTVENFRRNGSIDLLAPFLSEGKNPGELAQVLFDILGPRAEMAQLLIRAAVDRATPEDVAEMDDAIMMLLRAERERDAVAHAHAQYAFLSALLLSTHNLPLRWTANPFLDAVREILTRRPELASWDPSYAAFATAVRGSVLARNADAAAQMCRDFFEQVDAPLLKLLTPMLANGVVQPLD